ncbi:hypothetical protein FSARC_3611 [Fusarium sarcochroum]|uniref:Uncharacterized protein n=1 Tax=Fusarium sarcochroum TaxID=1208366 RepID=A0A8H4U3I0_9HYPO|nr:hypothetical protein FSARC_3611 [Fusarium sarcochroum]
MATIPSESHSRLDHLPMEVIARIFEFSHPTLKRHQIAHRENSLVSDLEPLTIPKLLQKVVRDPIIAWNDHWAPFVLQSPEGPDVMQMSDGTFFFGWPEAFQAVPSPVSQLADEELSICLGLLRKHGHLDQDDLDKARKDLSQGVDNLYKNLAFWKATDPIGTYDLYPSEVFCGIMTLPGLKSVYFRAVDIRTDIALDEDYAAGIHTVPYQDQVDCSSVEHIFLDEFCDSTDQDVEATLLFLQVPKALKTLTIRGGTWHGTYQKFRPEAIYAAMIHVGKSLESLIEYDAVGGEFRDDDTWRLYRGGRFSHIFKNLSTISINVKDLTTQQPKSLGAREKSIRELWVDPDKRYYCFPPIVEAFPKSLEVLLLSNRLPHEGTLDMEIMEETLIALIQSGRYSALKDIYIQEKLPWTDWFSEKTLLRLADVGRDYRIGVHIWGNKCEPRRKLEFPQAPTLKTLEDVKPREGHSGKVFDPLMGAGLEKGTSNGETSQGRNNKIVKKKAGYSGKIKGLWSDLHGLM